MTDISRMFRQGFFVAFLLSILSPSAHAGQVRLAAASLQIDTASLPDGAQGVAYSVTLAASGGQLPYTWSLAPDSSPLPPGLSVSGDGRISGTPTVTGTSIFVVRVTDAAANTDDRLLAIRIGSSIQVTTTILPDASVGLGYNSQLQVAGGQAPYTWSLAPGSAPLPPGLTLSSAGNISGTPTTNGGFSFSVRVTDAASRTADRALSITVNLSVQIETIFLPNGKEGTPYSALLQASGGQEPYTWSLAPGSGSLPTGLTLSASGSLSGTPNTNGNFSITIRATDSQSRVGQRTFLISITAAMQIETLFISDGSIGSPYNEQLQASGGQPPYTWSLTTTSGPLPPGLSLSAGGLISGTPTANGTFTFTVRVNDSGSRTAQRTFAITVSSGVEITTTLLDEGTVGSPYTVQLQVSGGQSPYAWSLAAGSGPLPPGVSLSGGGVISGTPTTNGVFTFTVQVRDANSRGAERILTLPVNRAVQIVTTFLPGGNVGSPYSAPLEAAGGQSPYTWSLATGSGPLPPGLTLSLAGNITGTPTSNGPFSFVVRVTDANSRTTDGNLAIVISSEVQITTLSLADGTVGLNYNAQLAATGGQTPYTWSLATGSAALPPGLSLAAGGAISGTSTAEGTFNFVVHVVDAGAHATERNFSITIRPVVQVVTSILPEGTAGIAYTAQFEATGGQPPYNWSLAPASAPLPSGLSLSAGGTISGAPGTNGSFTFTVRVADTNSHTTDKSFSLTINAALQISATVFPRGITGSPYTVQLEATGGKPPYAWALAPNSNPLPSGLNLSTTGTISGTPATNGTASVTVRVTDSNSLTTDRGFSIAIDAPLQITTASLPNGTAGSAYAAQFAAIGGQPPYAWSLATNSAPLPFGLNLSTSGAVSGAPTTNGTFSFTVRVTDSNSLTTNRNFSLTVDAVLQITTPSLARGTAGSPYNAQLEAAGGQPPYAWSLATNSIPLPSGLTLSTNGVISGTPATNGAFNLAVRVTDSSSQTTVKTLPLFIDAALQITSASLTNGTVGAPYSAQLEAVGGHPPYTWSLATNSNPLPGGLTLSTNGVISGAPATNGTFELIVRVADTDLHTADKNLSLLIKSNVVGPPDVLVYGVIKGQNFLQTSTSAGVLKASDAFVFSAFVDLSASNTVANATVRSSAGVTRNLSPESDAFIFEQKFSSQSALDANYPNGSFTVTINTVHDGTKTNALSLTGDAYPGTPRISNYSAAQTVNPTNDFTLEWDAFAGGTTNDFIELRIEDDSGNVVFSTPSQPGATGALNGASTSVLVPRNTLTVDVTYRAFLLFGRIASVDTNSYPVVPGLAIYSRETEFTISARNQAVALPPRLVSPKRLPNGQFQLQLLGEVGRSYRIEGSTGFTAWVSLTNSTTSASGTFDFVDPQTTNFNYRFYRAVVNP